MAYSSPSAKGTTFSHSDIRAFMPLMSWQCAMHNCLLPTSCVDGMDLSMILKFLTQACWVSPWKVCVQKKISYIVAPYEAHPQLAFLVSEGYAEFAISEDSDLLIYSCKEPSFIEATTAFVEKLTKDTVVLHASRALQVEINGTAKCRRQTEIDESEGCPWRTQSETSYAMNSVFSP
ncbi:hypothetical protein ACROYT_G014553 [Oculina patagonica]